MIELTQRLLHLSEGGPGDVNTACREAADMIIGLNGEIERLQTGWDQAFRIGVAAQEENVALRAAIAQIQGFASVMLIRLTHTVAKPY